MLTTERNKYQDIYNYLRWAAENKDSYTTQAGLVELQYALAVRLKEKPIRIKNRWIVSQECMEFESLELDFTVNIVIEYDPMIQKIQCKKYVEVSHISDKHDETIRTVEMGAYCVEAMTDAQIEAHHSFFQSFVYIVKEKIDALYFAEEKKIKGIDSDALQQKESI